MNPIKHPILLALIAGAALLGVYLHSVYRTKQQAHEFHQTARKLRSAVIRQSERPITEAHVRQIVNTYAEETNCALLPSSLRIVIEQVKSEAQLARLGHVAQQAHAILKKLPKQMRQQRWLIGFQATLKARHGFVNNEFAAASYAVFFPHEIGYPE